VDFFNNYNGLLTMKSQLHKGIILKIKEEKEPIPKAEI
jgi:hypothetical protein